MSSSLPLLALTIDVEWAPAEIIREMLAEVDGRGLRATLFCTHTPELKIGGRHEMALHPNFHGESDWASTFEQLRQQHPGAVGLRSHSLHSDTRLVRLLPNWGIRYQSNLFAPGQAVAPFRRETGLWEIPIHYMDFFHLCVPARHPKGFEAACLPSSQPLLVMDFHPIPWFVNAATLSDYEAAKEFYHEPAKLAGLRRKGPGVATLFGEVLDAAAAGRWQSVTLRETVELLDEDPPDTLWDWPSSTGAAPRR
ncbi:MAG: hypothetical protein IT578_06695 [Verrucomicrobiae bacterium]|nr:hypothetical protein [Verrucomicrobiae bacterium]